MAIIPPIAFGLVKRLFKPSHMAETYAIIKVNSSTCFETAKHNQLHTSSVRQDFKSTQYGSRRPLPLVAAVCVERHCNCVGKKSFYSFTSALDRGVFTGYMASQSLVTRAKCFRRCFRAAVSVGSQIGVGGSSHDKPESGPSDRQASTRDWTQRLANENGYLSWCRNSYLTTVVAIAMMGEGKTALAEQAAEGALFVAGLNLSWGTYQYIYNIFHLRHTTGMSFLGVLTYSSFALLHLGLWFMVCGIYLGYSEDADMKAIEEEAERQSKVV